MAIRLVYQPNVAQSGDALFGSSAAIAGAEQDQFDRQLAEEQRRFDLGLDYNAQVQGLEDRLQRSALGQRSSQFSQELQFRQQQQQADVALAEQQQRLQFEEQARLRYGQFSQEAQQRQQQQFQAGQAQQAAIIEARAAGLISDEQYQEAVPQWEQSFGMPWAFPQQMASEKAEVQGQQQIASLEAMFADPFNNGQSLAPEGAVQAMIDMGMPVDKIVDKALKMQTERRNLAKTQFEMGEGFQAEQKADEAHVADLERTDELTAQQMRQSQEKAIRDAAAAQVAAYQRQVSSYRTMLDNARKTHTAAVARIRAANALLDEGERVDEPALDTADIDRWLAESQQGLTDAQAAMAALGQGEAGGEPTADGEMSTVNSPAELQSMIQSGRVKKGDRVMTPNGPATVQ